MKQSEPTETSLHQTQRLIGQMFINLRLKLGYKSHETFATDFELPRVQYWRIEKGRANFTIKSLDRLVSIHGLTVEQFFAFINQSMGLSEKKNLSRS